MLQTNLSGAIRIISKNPQLLSVGAVMLKNRVMHKLSPSYLNGNVNLPEQITVVVTDICNLRCKMCHYAYSESPGFQLNRHGRMAPALFYKVMAEIPGHPIVTFTGGEPLLHPHIADMISHAVDLNRLTSLTTNGWMLAKRARALCEAGLDLLVVSVDGPPEIHNEIRGRNSFERLQEGIQAILEIIDRPLVFVSMALSNRNTHCLEELYDIAHRWGVDGVNFNHLWMQTHEMVEQYQAAGFGLFTPDEVPWETTPEQVDVVQLANALETLRAKNRGKSTLMVETPPLNRQEIACWYQAPAEFVKWNRTRCAWIRMKVWPDGSVKPCRGWQAGNIAEQHALEIWHSEQYTLFRQVLDEHGTIPLCSRCCYLAHR